MQGVKPDLKKDLLSKSNPPKVCEGKRGTSIFITVVGDARIFGFVTHGPKCRKLKILPWGGGCLKDLSPPSTRKNTEENRLANFRSILQICDQLLKLRG